MSRVVVVIGGGYGGSAVAKALDPEADVVLIGPRDAFVNPAGCPPPTGPAIALDETVSAYKGAGLFTGRFTEQFGAA
ncbi:hypothetical protein [Streptosporangium minutum]|uniref:Pyridine nucleotide-disulfide oxidoreductase n=1 Tax=Streptosporangium minutum TaxID=569862 RepID=A0A2C9ZM59_9ACTN|nr:hypothetical protein [Streptosporangium minutum]OUC95981.1 hypothetical protein CA984_16805 [Streptosporangium minutum]